MPEDAFTWIAAAVVAIVGTGRLVRLGAEDSWPPVLWARNKWIERFNTSNWSELAICPFCQGPYWAAITVAWALLSDFHWSWWVFYSWLSVAYLAAIVVARDIPDGEN